MESFDKDNSMTNIKMKSLNHSKTMDNSQLSQHLKAN